MVTVTVENIGPCKHRLNIEVPVEDIVSEQEKILSEFAKEASIPGFRKGKVPKKIIQSRFQDDILEETQKRIITRSYQDSVKNHKFNPVHMPKIENVQFEQGQPLSYTAELEVEPEIELKDYKAIKLSEEKQVVSEDEISEYLERLRDAHATLDAVEDRTLMMDDYAIIDYSLTDADDSVVEDGKAKLIFLSKEQQGFLSGVVEQMEGLNVGDQKDFIITLPETYYKKEYAGQEVRLDLTLQEIKQKVLPELDDEFAKNIGNFETLDALSKEIEDVLLDQKKQEQKAISKQKIAEYLDSKHSFELPQSLVDSELRGVLREKMSAQNKDEQVDEKKLEKEARQEAEKRVKIAYILADIAEKEKIKVEKKEIDSQIIRMAASFHMSADKLKSQLVDNGAIYGLQERILHDKVLDFLYDNANVSEK